MDLSGGDLPPSGSMVGGLHLLRHSGCHCVFMDCSFAKTIIGKFAACFPWFVGRVAPSCLENQESGRTAIGKCNQFKETQIESYFAHEVTTQDGRMVHGYFLGR